MSFAASGPGRAEWMAPVAVHRKPYSSLVLKILTKKIHETRKLESNNE
jgi:hypothetical protein